MIQSAGHSASCNNIISVKTIPNNMRYHYEPFSAIWVSLGQEEIYCKMKKTKISPISSQI